MITDMLVHGSAAVLGTRGLLVKGASGSGKSTLIFAVLAECRRLEIAGSLVGDDQLNCVTRAGNLIAHCIPTICGKIEMAFSGIVEIPYTPSAAIDLIVELKDAADLDRMPERKASQDLAGLPVLALPARQIEICVPLILSHMKLV